MSSLPSLDFHPDVIHCHDWQTGLIPVYLDNFRYLGEYYRGIKTVMTIHNLKFQGVWDTKSVREITGLPEYYFVPDKMEAYKDANLLKGGIVYADKVTTVSNSYAEEIKTPFYGEGLDGLMSARANDLCGIVNGLDYTDWDPASDPRIAKTFSVEDFRKNKVLNKKALQEELGLEKDTKTMMIGMIVTNIVAIVMERTLVSLPFNMLASMVTPMPAEAICSANFASLTIPRRTFCIGFR